MIQTRLSSHRDEATKQAVSQPQYGQPVPTLDVPQRPALAPHVTLVGEMPETGFKDRQWLLQRDSQFIQLTELLYRVAEQTNGERTLEEIAIGITEATDWLVSAENVRQLLQTKLIPLGLIAPADGAVVPQGEITGKEPVSSPLRINMPMKVISPRYLAPVARMFQVLHTPP